MRFTGFYGAAFAHETSEPKRLVGQSLAEYFPQQGSEVTPMQAHEKALSGRTAQFQFSRMGRVLQANLQPIRSGEGQIEGVAGAAIDITERSVAESALRLSEQSYRLLIEEAPYAICRSTFSGQLLQVNRAMVEMLAYESEAELLLSSMATDIFGALTEFHEFLERFGGPVSRYGFESQWRREDGQLISVSLGGRAVRDRLGRVSFFEIIAENITERKQLESQLRQAQKMQAVGQLAGGIAHDFNNLLTVIKGQLELALYDIGLDHSARPRLEEVEQAANRAATLTRQLLAFGRMQPLQSRPINLNAVIATVIQLLARLIGEKINLRFVPEEDLGFVYADPGQMEQIVMNLAVNARDAMQDGGTLTVSTSNLRRGSGYYPGLDFEQSDEFVCLTVQDTGHGMTAETQARIYEPFFTTKHPGKGTGLGLWTVYAIVRQSKGHIHVESAPGQGATFRVFLPKISTPASEMQSAKPTPIRGGTETILVVEDETSIRELFAAFLRKLGYRVTSARDGLEALEICNTLQGRIDLLLTDIAMPGLGGVELSGRLAAAHPEMKIVLMSGYAGEASAVQMLKESGAVLLQKPFSATYMAETVRNVLDGIDGPQSRTAISPD